MPTTRDIAERIALSEYPDPDHSARCRHFGGDGAYHLSGCSHVRRSDALDHARARRARMVERIVSGEHNEHPLPLADADDGPLYTCQQCGQASIPSRLVTATDRGGVYTVPPRCDTCTAVDREPQGETVRLFEPAPTQINGQLSL